ncbi:MAG: dTDP-4-dehydrorhamnose reductase [Novosphingobium sp.]
MRVVITGGQGQVARALAANAPSAWEVSTLTRQELDITDARSIHDAMKRNNPSLVVNAAAYTAVDKAETDEEAAFLVNGQGVANLTEICASIDARLVHFSTDFVFNGNQSRPYRRDDKPAPRSVYGKSKLSGELEALKLPANLVIRTAWVYGHSGANFVKTMLRLMGERQEVRVVSDQIGTPTHAQSLARAMVTPHAE